MDAWLGLCPPTANTSLHMRDNGVCLVSEDGILLAVSEERLSRRKHDHRVNRSLEHARSFARRNNYTIRSATLSTCSDAPWSAKAGNITDIPTRLCPSHHYSHALSAFLTSPFTEALIVVADAGGNTFHKEETSTWWEAPREQTTLWYGVNGSVVLLERRHSASFDIGYGEWYRAFTYYLGWPSHTLSGNTMALAAFGDNTAVSSELLWDEESGTFGGSIRNYPPDPIGMVRMLLARLGLGERYKTRIPREHWTYEHACLAAYLQRSLERSIESTVVAAIRQYGQSNVVLSGGVAQNCVMAAKLAAMSEVTGLFVSGYSSDIGQCVGNALHGRLIDVGDGSARDGEKLFLGPPHSSKEISASLRRFKLSPTKRSVKYIAHEIADRIASGQIIALYEGRSEFGARALGHRSVLCDPSNEAAVLQVKQKVKQRDDFMPLAPVISVSAAQELSSLPLSKTMTLAPILPELWRREFGESMHVDGSARIQVCDADSIMGRAVEDFAVKTGRRAIINTSLNKRGEPIVESPAEALRATAGLGIDILVLEDMIIEADAIRRSAAAM
jgi:carbamoyltransferase